MLPFEGLGCAIRRTTPGQCPRSATQHLRRPPVDYLLSSCYYHGANANPGWIALHAGPRSRAWLKHIRLFDEFRPPLRKAQLLREKPLLAWGSTQRIPRQAKLRGIALDASSSNGRRKDCVFRDPRRRRYATFLDKRTRQAVGFFRLLSQGRSGCPSSRWPCCCSWRSSDTAGRAGTPGPSHPARARSRSQSNFVSTCQTSVSLAPSSATSTWGCQPTACRCGGCTSGAACDTVIAG